MSSPTPNADIIQLIIQQCADDGDYPTLFNLLMVSRAVFLQTVPILYVDAAVVPYDQTIFTQRGNKHLDQPHHQMSEFSKAQLEYVLSASSGYAEALYGPDPTPAATWLPKLSIPTTVNYFSFCRPLTRSTLTDIQQDNNNHVRFAPYLKGNKGNSTWDWKKAVDCRFESEYDLQVQLLHVRYHGSIITSLSIPAVLLIDMIALVEHLPVLQHIFFGTLTGSSADHEKHFETHRDIFLDKHLERWPGVLQLVHITPQNNYWDWISRANAKLSSSPLGHLTKARIDISGSNDCDLKNWSLETVKTLDFWDARSFESHADVLSRCRQLEHLSYRYLQLDAFIWAVKEYEQALTDSALSTTTGTHHSQKRPLVKLRSLHAAVGYSSLILTALFAFRETLEHLTLHHQPPSIQSSSVTVNGIPITSDFTSLIRLDTVLPKLKTLTMKNLTLLASNINHTCPNLELLSVDYGGLTIDRNVIPFVVLSLPTSLTHLSLCGLASQYLLFEALEPLHNLETLELSGPKPLGALEEELNGNMDSNKTGKDGVHGDGWLFPKLKILVLGESFAGLRYQSLCMVAPRLEQLRIQGYAYPKKATLDMECFEQKNLGAKLRLLSTLKELVLQNVDLKQISKGSLSTDGDRFGRLFESKNPGLDEHQVNVFWRLERLTIRACLIESTDFENVLKNVMQVNAKANVDSDSGDEMDIGTTTTYTPVRVLAISPGMDVPARFLEDNCRQLSEQEHGYRKQPLLGHCILDYGEKRYVVKRDKS